jgi:hypothetical protein
MVDTHKKIKNNNEFFGGVSNSSQTCGSLGDNLISRAVVKEILFNGVFGDLPGRFRPSVLCS